MHNHLFVVVDNDGSVTQVEVCTVSFAADLQAFNFFAVLYGAVHCLLAQPISNNAPGMVPIRGMGDATVLDLSRTRNAHAFHSGNTVYKLYDNQFCKLQPNFDAIQSIDSDYLPDMKVVPLTDDKRSTTSLLVRWLEIAVSGHLCEGGQAQAKWWLYNTLPTNGHVFCHFLPYFRSSSLLSCQL